MIDYYFFGMESNIKDESDYTSAASAVSSLLPIYPVPACIIFHAKCMVFSVLH